MIDLELDAPDSTTDSVPLRPSPGTSSSWSAQPSRMLEDADVEPEPIHRRWPIVVMFLAFAILVALAVGFFLQAPEPAPVAERQQGIDGTVVDLPATAPTSPGASAGQARRTCYTWCTQHTERAQRPKSGQASRAIAISSSVWRCSARADGRHADSIDAC